MPQPNQLDKLRAEVEASAAELIAPASGTITEAGVRNNIEVAILYLAAWLGGNGCVPIHHLMEDAATAEISRAQLWQWARTGAQTDSGITLTLPLLEQWLKEESAILMRTDSALGMTSTDLDEAAELLWEMISADQFPTFLTLPAYDRLIARERA